MGVYTLLLISKNCKTIEIEYLSGMKVSMKS